jgi:hypothetical protein
MAEPTIETMLENVRTAMNTALVAGGAIEWEYNGRRVRHDYNQLLEIEKSLMLRQSTAASNGRLGTLAAFESRPT